MLLSLTSTAPSASDLGFLLHKHPDKVQTFDLPVGTAHVFYPEATDRRCTATLLLEVDPIELVRGKRFGGDGFALGQYVNDRPYAASSMLSVALGRVFGTAMRGECRTRPELPGVALPLTVHLAAVACRGGRDLAEQLFGPLGWAVAAEVEPLDPQIASLQPERPWGDSRYLDLTLSATITLADALTQLYVLLPVMDDAKHYWVSGDEIDKLVARGGAWLRSHPQRELILERYLAHQRSYVADATERLTALDDQPIGQEPAAADTADQAPSSLAQLRKAAVLTALRDAGAHRVVDLGCGEGALLRELLQHPEFDEIVGADVSARELARATRRLGLDRMPYRQRARITLLQSSATYRDRRLAGYDAVVLMEVIEHLDQERLPALERSVFHHAAPDTVLVTTPNAEYNVLFPGLPTGSMRHPDHRFEWTRTEFARWAEQVAEKHRYRVEFRPVGPVAGTLVSPEVGPPTQLALFRRVSR